MSKIRVVEFLFTDCGPFCSLCNTTGSCTECVDGFYIDDNHNCSACSDHCSLCTKDDGCLDCVTGYYVDTNTGLCQGCDWLGLFYMIILPFQCL